MSATPQTGEPGDGGASLHSPVDGDAGTHSTGVALMLGAGTMLFAGLFLAYGLVRAREPEWPPGDLPTLSPWLPALATSALVLSTSGLLAWSKARWLCVLGGVGFLALQLFSWRALWSAGVTPSSGPFASLVYGLTWLHALHTLVGVLGLAWRAVQAKAPGGWGPYWHFVGAVWLAIAAALFLA